MPSRFNSKIPELHKKKVKVRTLNKEFNFSLLQLLVFGIIFAAVGGIIIWRSLAAPPVLANLEAETMQPATQTTTNTISSSVSTSSDDAEQSPNQSMYLDSSDLEMVDDPELGAYGQKVGLRFTNISIPKGATINKAYIQFRADESQADTTSLNISGQAADNPSTFSTSPNDIGGRPRTIARVPWSSISSWTTNSVAASQQTPDLKAIAQEIVNRSGWASNNAMVFVVEGSGHRTADGFEDTETGRQTAKLIIEYSQPLAAPTTNTISSSVSTSSDDAEQTTSQNMSLDSSDLEMTDDTESYSYGQKVGLRFNNLAIPKGSTINKAYIQLRADESQADATSLNIAGQAADNPGTFTTAFNDLGARGKTTARVPWSNIPAWTAGGTSATQQTPDLKTIVQEIASRPGWNSNNSMVFIIEGTGHRTADAYDDTEAGRQTAKLVVEFTQNQTPTSVISDSTASSGKALLFNQNSSVVSDLNLPSTAESISIAARGVYCNGDWPSFNLYVDNNLLLTSKSTSSSWSSYAINKTLLGGAHNIKIDFINFDSCGRQLIVDVISFYGPSASQPIVSLNASPTSVTSGSSSTLTWGSTNASSCTASGGWSGLKPTSGSQSTGPISITTQYTLTCSGSGGTASATAAVVVSSPAASASSSLGMFRINYNQPIPSDLSSYKLLILDAARGNQVAGLKSRYPQLKILGYKNLGFAVDYSNDINGGAGLPWSQAQANPSWFLKDSYGNRVASVNFSTHWFMDTGLTAYQDAWSDNVISFLRSAPWDGVLMDDTNSDPGWHLGGNYAKLSKYPTRDAYRAAVRSMLASVGPKIKSAGYLAIPNIGDKWDQPDVWGDWASLTSGALREHYLKWGEAGGEPVLKGADWKLHTDAQRSVENAGRLFVALTYGTTTESQSQTYVRASFLLFWQPTDSSVGIWSVNDSTSFTTDLGLPKAAATQSGSVWNRQFDKGYITVDTSAGTAVINKY